MTNMIARTVFILSFLIFSCATPDPSAPVEITLNPPLSVEITHFNSRIHFKIRSYNTAQNSPDFAGYNVYFGDSPFTSVILTNAILSTGYLDLPALHAVPSDSEIVFDYVLENNILFTNRDGLASRSRTIDLYQKYYFMIRAWDERLNKENVQSAIYAVQPSYKILDQSINEETIWTHENFSITLHSNSIEPAAGVKLRSAGWQQDWESQRFAPASNYSSQSWPVIEGEVFFASCGPDFAKIQILSRSNNVRQINFSYQKAGTDL